MKRFLVTLLILLIVAAGVYWYQAKYPNRTTKVFRQMPTGKIQIVNDSGKTLTLQVKLATDTETRTAGFNKVGSKIIDNHLLLYTYPRDTVERHVVKDVRGSLDLAFFDAEGKLLQLVTTKANTTLTYGITSRYRYLLMAPEGYFKTNNISAVGKATLIPDSLQTVK